MLGLCDRFIWAVREHQRSHRLQPIPAKKGAPFDFNKLGCEIWTAYRGQLAVRSTPNKSPLDRVVTYRKA